MKKLLIVLVFLSFGSIYAGGYRVALQGQRMLGMAHAGLSVFKNTETAFFNPAGINFLEDKISVSFGVSGIMSHVKYQNETYNQYAETENPLGTPLYLYMTYQATDKIGVGLAVYTPFGSSTVWNKWVGSQIVNDISLKVFYIQPSVAYKLTDNISASASFILAFGEVSYNKDINRYLTDEQGNKTYAQLESGMTSGMGYAFSIAAKPAKNLSLGINYRSEITIDAQDGKAEFHNVPAFLSDKLTSTGFSAQLPMPAELGIGASYQVTDDLLVAFDYNYTFWDVYKELKIEFDNDLPPSIADKSYHNSGTYRLGLEYQLSDNMFARAGYYFDESPLSEGHFSPETPSLDTNNYTFGFGYKADKLSFDLSFLYVSGKERTDYTIVEGEGTPYRFEGTYVNNAIIPGFGITYSLD